MSNIGTLLFHLRRIQQSSCQRQRAGLADCELPQGPAASAHFMFVLALYAHPRSSLGMNSLDDRNRVGVVLLLHAVSTFSSFHQYLHPFEGPNLLFFAAWPMLGACFTLYYLRDLDTLFRLGSSNRLSAH